MRSGSEHLYVGATLCSSTQYKLWLSDSLYGTFSAMGDQCGYGQDHCNHIGGSEISIDWDSTSQSAWEGWQGCSDGDLMTYKFFDSNAWVPYDYDCAVSIP